MEDVDVVVVVPQRAQRLHDLARSAGVRLRRRSASVASGRRCRCRRRSPSSPVTQAFSCVNPVYCVEERCSSYSPAWASQPVHERDVDDDGDQHELHEGGDAVDERRPAASPSARRRSGARRRSTARRGRRTRRAGRARSTWCRSPARSRRRRSAARGGTAARARVPSRRVEAARRRRRRATASPGAVPVAVVDHAGDAAQQEERQEDVEQRQPREHEVQAVEGQQQAGQAAERRSSR